MPAAKMLPHRTPTIALLGNPNTGKTTLFNALAGMNQRVGNYPGVTVESKKCRLHFQKQSFEVIDLPGTYSLAPRSPDEMLAVELILGQQHHEPRPDVVVTIVDASNLDRNLYLTTQVLELGVPVVVALNMIDVARNQGITIDHEELGRRLGVRVVPIQANKAKGLEQLKEAIVQTMAGPAPCCNGKGVIFPEVFEREVLALSQEVQAPRYLLRRLLIDVGGYTERFLIAQQSNGLLAKVVSCRQRLAEAGCPIPAVEARTRYAWIRAATKDCVQRPSVRPVTWTDRLDRILTHKIWGTALFLLLMFIVFESIFFWAKPLMEWIDLGKEKLADAVRVSMSPGPLRSLLSDGVIAGVGGVLVFLPQIMILFAFIAVLEDCGYMARAAFLMDKLMARCGLNGKSFIPLLSSVACAVPGIMATRVIENRRDRLATVLVAPLMSCSARLPVYLLLIGAFLSAERGFAWWVPGLTLFGLYMIGLVMAPAVALILKRTLLRGEPPVFVMEMPLYKVPSLYTVWRRVTDAGNMFVRRAGTLILASMVLVWALLYFPGGTNYDRLIAPLEEKLEQATAKKVVLDERGENAKEVEDLVEKLQGEINEQQSQWKGASYLGQMGKAIEPAVKPLGWDWRIGMAALASFPAREVFVGTMGIIYGEGKGDAKDAKFTGPLAARIQNASYDDEPDRKVFSVPVAMSVMVFFALCCQCASTLAVIKRETNSWLWPAFTFLYMTILAYVGALIVYQVGNWFAS
jgi:ferrous iron transport protein B